MKLHLGVIDVPEPYENKSTYDVGVDLEKNYKFFSSFYDAHTQEISDLIAKDAAIGLDMMLKDGPVSIEKVFAVSADIISDKMQTFISTQEAESVVKPVLPLIAPTLAAQEGLSYRFDKGYSAKRQVKGLKGQGKQIIKRAPRPSFQYSGVFEASLKAEIK
jgi:hypothetical protein